MANNYGTNPWVFDTAPYVTGTVSVTQDTYAVTLGGGGDWTAARLPASAQEVNRDRVSQLSTDSGTTWYNVLSVNYTTDVATLETKFNEATVTDGAYLNRILLVGRKKLNAIVWLNPTANDELVFRDAKNDVIAILRAGTTEQAELIFATPKWVDGFALAALPSGTAYVYYD